MKGILVIASIQKCAKSKKQTLFYIKGTKGSCKIREQKRFKISDTRGNSRGICKSICKARRVYGKEIRSTSRPEGIMACNNVFSGNYARNGDLIMQNKLIFVGKSKPPPPPDSIVISIT